MRVTLVPSSIGGDGRNQYLSSYLINDAVAIDAGSIGFFGAPADQERIRHVFLTHAHVDHVASLPIFLENVFDASGECVTTYGSEPALESLRRDMFNDRIWPDFVAMSGPQRCFVRLATLEPNQPISLAGLRITPVPVNHVVPTFGFMVEDASSAVIIATDTAPTEEIWRLANRTPTLKAVFLDSAFPNSLSWLAEASGHLTPMLFAAEVRKLARPTRVIAVHIKARYYDEVVRDLLALRMADAEIGQYGRTYEF